MDENSTQTSQFSISDDPSRQETAACGKNGVPFTLDKCLRRGENVCYNEHENIVVLRKISGNKAEENEFDGGSHLEDNSKFNNGVELSESNLFQFNQFDLDEETTKCLCFWKMVMERNLQPVKCNFLSSTFIPPPESILKQTGNETEKKKLKSKQSLKTVSVGEKSTERSSKVKEFNWTVASEQLQKYRLKNVKLKNNEPCNICNYLAEKPECDDFNIEIVKKEVEELNLWNSNTSSKPKNSLEK